MDADYIGNFPKVDPNCAGCGKPLVIENAWMTDGCPCNTPLGVNNMNETRWRLLMQLQQRQSFEIERLRKIEAAAMALSTKMVETEADGGDYERVDAEWTGLTAALQPQK